jgi:L-ascorbate metabolism protein UlaG (beta-lactamase superfamily)
LVLTWLGHATALLDLDGTRLLTDPVLGDRVGPLVRTGPSVRRSIPGGVDMILLSHLHADHAEIASLRGLGAPVLAPRGAGEWLAARGVRTVEELSPGQSLTVARTTVTATHAEHDARRWPLVSPKAQPIGFHVRASRAVYFAGDTDLHAAMGELTGSVDLALLPVSGWGRKLGPGHLDPLRAARAAAIIAPVVAVPIHWGTFALPRPLAGSSEPDRPAREFATYVGQLAPEVDVRLVPPGGSLELPAAVAR